MMNDTPENGSRFVEKLKNLWAVITDNWGWKLMCFIIAILLWGSIISQDTSLTREKVIRNVPITVVNGASLQRNGLIIVSGIDELPEVTIRVQVPVRNYQAASASNYTVRLDLATISQPGEQTVQLTAGSSSSGFGSIVEISEDTIDINVEEYVTRSRIPVRIRTSGTVPEGYYANAATAEVNEVTVSGPKSLVNQIARCVVSYTMPTLRNGPGSEYTSSPIEMTNAQDEQMDMSFLTVTVDSWGIENITVQQTFYPMYTVKVADMGVVQGTPKDGYEIKNITYSPQTVSVADMDLESHTGDYVYLSGTVDVSGLDSTVMMPLQVSRPGGFVYISTDIVYVTVEIGPVQSDKES